MLVLSLLAVEGEAEPNFDKIAPFVPTSPGGVVNAPVDDEVYVQDLFPDHHKYYLYTGSETSPPCLTGVRHMVFTDYITMSAQQMNRFRRVYSGNARPVQPLGSRVVEKYVGPNAPDYRQRDEKVVKIPGPKGAVGAIGRQGQRGPQGPRGDRGPQGDAGLDGVNGRDGAQGPAGEQGNIGVRGSVGPAGETGQQGERGDVGEQGVSGKDGKDGKDGVGPQGPQGPQGPTTKGNRGPMGYKGSKGHPGVAGDDGDQGPTGPAGDAVSASGKGPKGPQGYPGERGEDGPAGPKGDVGVDGVTGPRGPLGPEGPAGPQGWRGPMKPGWGAVTSLYAEIEAEAVCSAMKEQYTFAITRRCETGAPTCVEVCREKKFESAMAMHIYQANQPFTDLGQLGLKTYVGAGYDSNTACGPNFCCCTSATRPGYELPPKPTLQFSSRRAGYPSFDDSVKQVIDTQALSQGYCEVYVQSLGSVNNQGLCGGYGWNAYYINSRLQIKFTPRTAKNWRFRAGVDYTWGGVAYLDGVIVTRKRGSDMWWAGNWDNSAGVIDVGWTSLDANKAHTVEFYGAEYCCDGGMSVQFDDGSGWRTVTVEALYEASK